MKKLFLILLASAGISSAAHAQGARLGLKIDTSLSNFVGEDADGASNKFGINGGFVAELGITDNFAIQPEVIFSMKGAKIDEFDARYNQNYVDVPVLLKVKANGLFFQAGPQVGLLIDSKVKNDAVAVNSAGVFKTIDFGYVAGLGYELSSGPMIGLRYNGGISKVYKKEDQVRASDLPEVRNSVFQLYVGFLFGGQ